jgi:DNA-binding GntR family transcriptional regulator
MALMQRAVERELQAQLLATHLKLAQALAALNWDEIAKVNTQVNDCLLRLAQHQELSENLLQLKQQLQQLHGNALRACIDECEKLRINLLTQVEYAEGRSAYLRTDTL